VLLNSVRAWQDFGLIVHIAGDSPTIAVLASSVDAMNTPQIPPERWIANLLEAARLISDRDYQERRWLEDDALAWETPDEAINMLDDSVLNGFIEQFGDSFSPAQANAVIGFRDEVDHYREPAPQHLEPRRVLIDPAWETVRKKASDFIQAFDGKWPNSAS
jgi:hypothetical protein